MGVKDVLRLQLKMADLPKLDSQNLRQGCTGFGGVKAHPATGQWPLLAASRAPALLQCGPPYPYISYMRSVDSVVCWNYFRNYRDLTHMDIDMDID